MPSSEFLVRPAIKEDCPQMLELVRELAVFERAPEAVTVTLSHFEESGFGDKPVWWAWVASPVQEEHQGAIIGFALYYIRYSTWKGQRMYLEDLLVTEVWRGKGVGGLLMDALIQDARKKELHGISWQVLDWNNAAVRFYERYNARFEPEWVNVAIDV